MVSQVYTENKTTITKVKDTMSEHYVSTEVTSLAEVLSRKLPFSWLKNGEELLDAEMPYILTLCEKLDEALGGGIPLGSITEVAGIPGVGKTQLCIQLACDVQIPSVFGGLEAEAIYVDMKGGLILERVRDAAFSTIDHCHYISNSTRGDKDTRDLVSVMTVEQLLAGIHTYSCSDHLQLIALANLLPLFLEKNQRVRLLVLDSVAFHFRHDLDDLSLRTRLLTHLLQSLLHIAHQFSVAVVLTNQMTTKVRAGSETCSHLVPALGESWGHACTTRIILQHEGALRSAHILKSPTQKPSTATFQITEAGIRDVISLRGDQEARIRDVISLRGEMVSVQHHESSECASKRQRLA